MSPNVRARTPRPHAYAREDEKKRFSYYGRGRDTRLPSPREREGCRRFGFRAGFTGRFPRELQSGDGFTSGRGRPSVSLAEPTGFPRARPGRRDPGKAAGFAGFPRTPRKTADGNAPLTRRGRPTLCLPLASSELARKGVPCPGEGRSSADAIPGRFGFRGNGVKGVGSGADAIPRFPPPRKGGLPAVRFPSWVHRPVPPRAPVRGRLHPDAAAPRFPWRNRQAFPAPDQDGAIQGKAAGFAGFPRTPRKTADGNAPLTRRGRPTLCLPLAESELARKGVPPGKAVRARARYQGVSDSEGTGERRRFRRGRDPPLSSPAKGRVAGGSVSELGSPAGSPASSSPGTASRPDAAAPRFPWRNRQAFPAPDQGGAIQGRRPDSRVSHGPRGKRRTETPL